MKILFSPIGGTDPISERNLHEGALLHISRHYKPDVVYLYMSKEILEKHDKDDRYRYCLNKLGERLSHNFEIRIIERRELEQVQLFDPIYTDFERILDDITSNMASSDQLLLNISSGTPAMKSALLVLATMMDISCLCIQSDTPDRKMNQHQHSKEYNPEEYWELNLDNEYRPGDKDYDRTHAEKLISLKRLKYEETIKKYVASYNYHAALTLAGEMKAEYTGFYLDKLKLAAAREQLDFYAVNELLRNQDPEIYSPVRKAEDRRVFEYMLSLQAKVARHEYSDFIRGLSPILVDLFEGILRKQAHFNLADFTYATSTAVYWDMEKLRASGHYMEILNNAYTGGFQGGWVRSDHLVKLINGLVSDHDIIDCVGNLRMVENNVRNMAAHKMISVSDQFIKNETGFTSAEIVSLIHKAFTGSSYNIRKKYWNSYNDMNADIIRSIYSKRQK